MSENEAKMIRVELENRAYAAGYGADATSLIHRVRDEACREIAKLRARVAELERENSALAAGQCHDGYGDDRGNFRCRYQDRIAELEGMERERDACCDDYQREARRAVAAEERIAELEREVARYRAMIPVECCAGADPNCYGPRGCLVRAEKADLTPNDVLAERVIDLEREVADLSRDNEWMRNAPLNSIWANRIAKAEAEVSKARAEERHANETVASLVAKITTLVDKARAEEREAIVKMIRKAPEVLYASDERHDTIERIQRRGQEGSDGA